MLRKLLIRTWFGPLPPWVDQWRENTESLGKYGFDFLLVNDYPFFARRCQNTLGIEIAPYEQVAGTRKAGDFDPAYGVIFFNEIQGYDFWGHCALDMVFGRLDRFVSDEFLSDCDVFANDPGAICGPFSLYRYGLTIRNLFQCVPGWEQLLSDAKMHGFDEIQFNREVQKVAKTGEIRFKTAFWQSHDKQEGHVPTPQLNMLPDGTLMDQVTGKETAMFHFNRYRQWPIGAS